MDGWMDCYFTSFLTVLESYQDGGRVITKGCVQWTPFTVGRISSFSRSSLEPVTARSGGPPAHTSMAETMNEVNAGNSQYLKLTSK